MSSKLFDLSGRTALIAGSTQGLGNVLAQSLAEAGAAIVMNGRHAAQLSAAAGAFKTKGHTVHEALFDGGIMAVL
jgi:gluconate 5-dehydrogenase